MDANEIWKFISAVLANTISLSKLGIPAVIGIYGSNYVMALISSCTGAILGTVVFTYLSAGILKWWAKLKERWFPSKKPKKNFTKSNRRVINIKRRFGLLGIAIITPVILSIPIGAFLAERFFKDKKKIIIYLSISGVFWCFTFYFAFLFFYDTFKALFN